MATAEAHVISSGTNSEKTDSDPKNANFSQAISTVFPYHSQYNRQERERYGIWETLHDAEECSNDPKIGLRVRAGSTSKSCYRFRYKNKACRAITDFTFAQEFHVSDFPKNPNG